MFTVLAAAVPADAAPRVDIGQAALSEALAELARETGVDLLFDEALVHNLKAAPIHGSFTAAEALSMLLAGTGIGYRVTPDRAFVLFAFPRDQAADTGDGAIAELLVVGRRTQNADIRRTQNDIQPYKISGRSELSVAQHDNLDQFMRGRVPADGQITPPSQDVVRLAGSTRSAIDLRGAGTQRTLVLIDGRRIPSVPSGANDLQQGDLNGVPLGAVERIETLTATAGGIYGPSAIGGVVNIVLRRDYRGADFTLTSGVTDRGDAGQVRLEARVGFTPDHGHTDIMLFTSFAQSQPLYAEQRDYELRSLRRQMANDPAAYLGRMPISNVVSVFSGGGPLRLDPQLGGATLASGQTFLPLDFKGGAADRIAALVANSSVDTPIELPPGRAGELAQIVSTPRVGSMLFNVRHHVSDHLELFVDGLYFINQGRALSPLALSSSGTSANAPSNPFAATVFFRFPTPDLFNVAAGKVEVSRFTGGFIAALPASWQGSADYAVGRTVSELSTGGRTTGLDLVTVLATGLPGSGGRPAIMPLADFAALGNAVSAYAGDFSISSKLINNFGDLSLRAAGPLGRLAGGPLTLTLLGEARREEVPASEIRVAFTGVPAILATPRRSQDVRSAYAELRAPLVRQDARFVLARGLEVQLAARHDSVTTTFPDNAAPGLPTNDALTAIRHEATVFTGGARVLPASWLMLRGSVATGQLPPDFQQLQSSQVVVADAFSAVPDPRRGGRLITLDGPYTMLQGGSHGVRPEEGRTISAGVVFNPSGRGGPRWSLDYSRIDARREIIAFPLSAAQLLAAEAAYPDRVVRAPLTAADASLGYTAGRVLVIDTGAINAGQTVIEAVDLQFDWVLPRLRRGQIRLYGSATWQPSFRRRATAASPWIERIGYADGPLAWRANAGLEWTQGSTTIDLNVQYFDSYRVTSSGIDATTVASNAQILRYQGASRIPPQAYVDLVGKRRFQFASGGLIDAIEVKLGVQNLFDSSPPIVAAPEDIGYSPYGDPRRRRLELMLSAQF